MYGLSADADLRFLLGPELVQVCFGKYNLQLHFTNGVSISAHSPVELSGGERCLRWRPGARCEDASEFLDRLGEVIAHVRNDGTGRLELSLSGGHRIILVDDSPMYESYELINGNDILII
ncbi:MAG: hypothetical protein IPM64_00825 [Phycisphaerales bacterium]|nr:hypothetical protein [Phycisphaerales bacterium]